MVFSNCHNIRNFHFSGQNYTPYEYDNKEQEDDDQEWAGYDQWLKEFENELNAEAL